MLKRTITFFISLTLILMSTLVFADTLDVSDIEGETAVLIDELTGQVLFDKDMNKKMYPASTTKMLTAILILENHALDEIVTIDEYSPFMKGKKVFLLEGERLTIEQLMYILLVESGNDAASALAIYHSGTIEDFSKEMNAKAKEIGALNSNFTNPHGLHEDNHYSTAYDLALIGRYGFSNETFRTLVNTKSYNIPATELQDERNYIRNTNRFLGASDAYKMDYRGKTIPVKYEIVDGIKTGYTPEAGNCLVSTAKIDTQRFISVVLNSNGSNSGLYRDSRTLLDYGFDNFQRYQFITEGTYIQTVQLEGAGNITVNLVAGGSKTKMLQNNIDVSQIKREVLIDQGISAPIAENQVLGRISFSYNNIEIENVPIVSEYAITGDSLITESEFSFIKKDENDQVDLKYYLGIFIKLLISFIIYRIIITTINLRKRKKRLQKSYSKSRNNINFMEDSN
ncbi:MAG: D-alanyl-D-alanine carboxypeptidase [Clostridiales bacterium]|nr:D-alanyl-D-alanine carboxypeptidase [Clostridiales bacterium]